jgi:hypothetical protein
MIWHGLHDTLLHATPLVCMHDWDHASLTMPTRHTAVLTVLDACWCALGVRLLRTPSVCAGGHLPWVRHLGPNNPQHLSAPLGIATWQCMRRHMLSCRGPSTNYEPHKSGVPCNTPPGGTRCRRGVAGLPTAKPHATDVCWCMSVSLFLVGWTVVLLHTAAASLSIQVGTRMCCTLALVVGWQESLRCDCLLAVQCSALHAGTWTLLSVPCPEELLYVAAGSGQQQQLACGCRWNLTARAASLPATRAMCMDWWCACISLRRDWSNAVLLDCNLN